MSTLPRDITATKAATIGHVIDHLVDALGGEPGCTLRRAVILADIDENPATTQSDIMNRLGANKSQLNRDIEWLYDYGCVMRTPSAQDGREIQLRICGYAKKNLDFSLEYFDFSHKNLKNFLIRLINLFGDHKPTLRDAKIMATIKDKNATKKKDVFESLYNSPPTTQNRAVNNLIELGVIKEEDEQQTTDSI